MKYPIRHGLCLTTHRLDDGRLAAVCSDGVGFAGHEPITALALEIVPSVAAAKEWFEAVKLIRPWEPRQ